MISGLRPQQWGAEVIRRMGGEFMEDYRRTHNSLNKQLQADTQNRDRIDRIEIRYIQIYIIEIGQTEQRSVRQRYRIEIRQTEIQKRDRIYIYQIDREIRQADTKNRVQKQTEIQKRDQIDRDTEKRSDIHRYIIQIRQTKRDQIDRDVE